MSSNTVVLARVPAGADVLRERFVQQECCRCRHVSDDIESAIAAKDLALTRTQLVQSTVAPAAVVSATLLATHPDEACATNGGNQSESQKPNVRSILAKAGKASLGGGTSGAAAAVVQVLSLMWLRTTMNYQYRNGGSTVEALKVLWAEGGLSRFYRGVSFALVQGPLSR